MSEKWRHYGDGVYGKFDAFGLMLHANSHDKPTDRVFLEYPILKSLNEEYERLKMKGEEDDK